MSEARASDPKDVGGPEFTVVPSTGERSRVAHIHYKKCTTKRIADIECHLQYTTICSLFFSGRGEVRSRPTSILHR